MTVPAPIGLPTASTTDPALVRFSPIDPALVPFTPPMPTVTVQVALGTGPPGTTLLIVGVPVSPLAGRLKLPAATPVTGSEKVTVQASGPEFTSCDAPARTIESPSAASCR